MAADYQLRADPGDGNDQLEATVRLQDKPSKGDIIAVWDGKSGSTMTWHGQVVWQGSENYLEVIGITHMPGFPDPYTYVEVRLQYPGDVKELRRLFEALNNHENLNDDYIPYKPVIDIEEALTKIEHLARASADDPLTLPTIQKLAAEAIEERE